MSAKDKQSAEQVLPPESARTVDDLKSQPNPRSSAGSKQEALGTAEEGSAAALGAIKLDQIRLDQGAGSQDAPRCGECGRPYSNGRRHKAYSPRSGEKQEGEGLPGQGNAASGKGLG